MLLFLFFWLYLSMKFVCQETARIWFTDVSGHRNNIIRFKKRNIFYQIKIIFLINLDLWRGKCDYYYYRNEKYLVYKNRRDARL